MEKRKHTWNNKIQSNKVDLSKQKLSVTDARKQGYRKVEGAVVRVVKKKDVQLTITQRFNQKFITHHESSEIAVRYAHTHYSTGSFKVEWKETRTRKRQTGETVTETQERLLTGNCDKFFGLRRHAFQASRSDMFGKVCDTARRGENEQLMIELHERIENTFDTETMTVIASRVLARRSLIVFGGKKDTGTFAYLAPTVVLTTQEQEQYNARSVMEQANFMLDKTASLGTETKIRTTSDAERKRLKKGLVLHIQTRKAARSRFATLNQAEKIITARMVALGFMFARPVQACKTHQTGLVFKPLTEQQQASILSPLSFHASQDRLSQLSARDKKIVSSAKKVLDRTVSV